MDMDFMENQINKRKQSDDEMFSEAFSDLLSVIGIHTPKKRNQTKGAIVQILTHLKQDIPTVPDNIKDLDAQLDYMLRPSNTMKRRVELKGKWWKESTGCFLASTTNGNVVAVLPGVWSGYEYIDSDGRHIKINEKTAKNLNIDAFCFYKAFPLKSLKIKDLVKFMFNNMSKVDLLFIGICMLIAQGIGMIQPEVQKIIYKYIIPSGVTNLLWPLAFFLFGITISQTAIGILRNVLNCRFKVKNVIAVNSAIMIRFFSLPTKFFKNYTAGELASRMGYIASLCQTIHDVIFSTLLTSFFSLGYFFSMNRYAPSLVVPGLSVVLVTVAYSVFMTFYQQRIYRKKLQIDPKLQSLTYALFGGIQKIKVTGSEKRAFAKWADTYSEVQKLTYSPPFLIKINSITVLIISSLGNILLYYFTISRGIALDDYMAFNSAFAAVSSAIMALSGVALKFANMGPILEMIRPVMEQTPENDKNRKIATSLSGNIDVSNVSFKYTEDGPTILDGINLQIKKGEYVAIVGRTGCGKSTLMRLLLGFETPDKGAIYYDGRDLKSLELRSVRQKIGVVMQNGSLFSGDIFSNIIITSPWKTMDDAWEAARMAGMEEDIKAMPMGMHTLISEGSGGLSGGQKQRIMIARAIIDKPKILFLDEATSALDNVTQHHVASSISQLNSTRIVIAHRLSTIKNCDRILVMDKGKIIEQGSYDELMAKKGEFYELAIRQVAE